MADVDSFIPLAPTFVTRALTRVLSLAVPEASDRPPMSVIQLIALTSNGDLRSAVNSLQLLCSRKHSKDVVGKKRKSRDGESWDGAKKKGGKGSRGGRGGKLDVSADLRAVYVSYHTSDKPEH
jgi:cell cycle checkpoint protein